MPLTREADNQRLSQKPDKKTAFDVRGKRVWIKEKSFEEITVKRRLAPNFVTSDSFIALNVWK